MKPAVGRLVRRSNDPDSDAVESINAGDLNFDRLWFLLVASGHFDRIDQNERSA